MSICKICQEPLLLDHLELVKNYFQNGWLSLGCWFQIIILMRKTPVSTISIHSHMLHGLWNICLYTHLLHIYGSVIPTSKSWIYTSIFQLDPCQGCLVDLHWYPVTELIGYPKLEDTGFRSGISRCICKPRSHFEPPVQRNKKLLLGVENVHGVTPNVAFPMSKMTLRPAYFAVTSPMAPKGRTAYIDCRWLHQWLKLMEN